MEINSLNLCKPLLIPRFIMARRDRLADARVDGAWEDGVASDPLVAEAPGDVFGCANLYIP